MTPSAIAPAQELGLVLGEAVDWPPDWFPPGGLVGTAIVSPILSPETISVFWFPTRPIVTGCGLGRPSSTRMTDVSYAVFATAGLGTYSTSVASWTGSLIRT